MPALTAIFGGNASGLFNELRKVRAMGAGLASSFSHEMGNKLLGLVSVGAVEEVVRRTVEYGEQISILSQRLGISTDAVQQWDYALKQNGSSIESAAGFFEKLATARKKAMDGQAEYIASFHRLGIEVADLKSKRLEDIAAQIARAFQSGDPQKLIADLREVGGRGAGEMVAAFQGGLGELLGSASVIESEVIDRLREAADQMHRLGFEARSFAAPAIAWMAETATKALQGMQVVWAGISAAWKGQHIDLERGLAGAMEAYRKITNGQAADTDARGRRKNAVGIGGADAGEAKASKAAKEELRLQERLQKLIDENYLKSLTKKERVTELYRRKEENDAMIAQGGLVKDAELRAKIYSEELTKQISAAEKESNTRALRGPLTHLQQIGAYAPASSTVLVDTTKKMALDIRDLKDHVIRGGAFHSGGRSRF